MADKQTGQFRLGRSLGLRGLAFGLVLLGGCVFGWGLRYKLSLYDPPHAITHRMPEAKLLSGKECGAFALMQIRPVSLVDLPPALSLLLLAFVTLMGYRLCSGGSTLRPALARPRGAPQCVPRLASSIRPPPQRL